MLRPMTERWSPERVVSPELAARSTDARVVNDESTSHLSDHYPVVADFHWEAPAED